MATRLPSRLLTEAAQHNERNKDVRNFGFAMSVVVASFARLEQHAKKQLVLSMVKEGALNVLQGVREHVSDEWFTYLTTSSVDALEIFENYDASILIELAEVADLLPSLFNAYVEHVLTIHQPPELIYEIHTAFHILVVRWKRELHSQAAIDAKLPPLVRLLHWMYDVAPRTFVELSTQNRAEFDARCKLKDKQARDGWWTEHQYVVGVSSWSMLIAPEWIYVPALEKVYAEVKKVNPSMTERVLDCEGVGTRIPTRREQYCIDYLKDMTLSQGKQDTVSPACVAFQHEFGPENKHAIDLEHCLGAVNVLQLLSHGTNDWRLLGIMCRLTKNRQGIVQEESLVVIRETIRSFYDCFANKHNVHNEGHCRLARNWYLSLLCKTSASNASSRAQMLEGPLVKVWKVAANRICHDTAFFGPFFKSCFPTGYFETYFDSAFVIDVLWTILLYVVQNNLGPIADACMNMLTEWARKNNDVGLFTRRSKSNDHFDTFPCILSAAIENSFEMIPKLLHWIEWPDRNLVDAFEDVVLDPPLTLDSNRAFRCKTLDALRHGQVGLDAFRCKTSHALRHGQVGLEEHLQADQCNRPDDIQFVLEQLFTRMETLPEEMSGVFLPVYLLNNTPRILLLALQREHGWSNDVLSLQVLNECDASNRTHVEIAEVLMLPPLQLLPSDDSPGWLGWLNEKLYAPGGAGFLAMQSQHPEMKQETEHVTKKQRA